MEASLLDVTPLTGRLWDLACAELDYVSAALDDWVGWNFAVRGFATSYASALLGLLILMPLVVLVIWNYAKIGPARKTLSTTLVLIFGVPLYICLTGLGLALIWVAMFLLALCIAWMAPFLALMLYCTAITTAFTFISDQRRSTEVVEDITFADLFIGIFASVICLCTFGVGGALLTLLKAPVLFIGCTGQAVCLTLPHVFFAWTGSSSSADELCCKLLTPVLLLLWFIGFILGACLLAVGILTSVLLKLVVAAVWPAYVASGLLVYVGRGGRPRDRSLWQALCQGIKAGYQVFWFADILSNAWIVCKPDLANRAFREFQQIASGERDALSPECQSVSCLPPVVIGLFMGEWDMAERLVATALDVSVNQVKEAWQSLKSQMVSIGKEALEAGQLSEDYLASVPPELVIGLPARCMLDTIERSSREELVLASGLRIKEARRPRGAFADRAWGELQKARAALEGVNFSPGVRGKLCASLLAGGGDPAELPSGLAAALQEFDALPPDQHRACLAVQQPLIGLAVESSRQAAFRHELNDVVQTLWAHSSSLPAAPEGYVLAAEGSA